MNSWTPVPIPRPLSIRIAEAFCASSPTERHHRLVELSPNGVVTETCKHCGDVKTHVELRWPTTAVGGYVAPDAYIPVADVEETVLTLPAGFHIE